MLSVVMKSMTKRNLERKGFISGENIESSIKRNYGSKSSRILKVGTNTQTMDEHSLLAWSL